MTASELIVEEIGRSPCIGNLDICQKKICAIRVLRHNRVES